MKTDDVKIQNKALVAVVLDCVSWGYSKKKKKRGLRYH